jgi:type II secretory pathway component GspD/PulD (secretin)
MRIMLHRLVWVAGLLVAAALTPAARAQGLGQPRFIVVPTITNIRLTTTVTVPDGGTATVGGYSQVSEGRTEYGVPGLGKVPYVSRGFRNVGYGRSTVVGRVTASVRIIDLREEEYRQTGVRSP